MSTSGTPVNPEAPDLTAAAPTSLRSVHFTERAPNPEIAAENTIRLIELNGEKLEGEVELVAPGSLPNDGKVIADERTYT